MSNELSAIWVPSCVSLGDGSAAVWVGLGRGLGGFKSPVVPCYSSDLLTRRQQAGLGTADCPSGQWERTVNPSAYAYPGSNPGSATVQPSCGLHATAREGRLTVAQVNCPFGYR